MTNYKLKDYRPKNVEFCVDSDSIVPETLGEYKTDKEAVEFIHQNLTAINQKIDTFRFMDNYEKKELRADYQELLELKLPILEKEVGEANRENERTKGDLKTAKENYTAAINEVKQLANEVKLGKTKVELDDKYTWRVPYRGRFYFFTYMDKEIKLAKIKDIPEHEKDEIFNESAKNEDFFVDNFGPPLDVNDEYLKGNISAAEFAKKENIPLGKEIKKILDEGDK